MFKKVLICSLFISTLVFGESNILNSNTGSVEQVVQKKPNISFIDTFLEFNRMGGIFMYPLYLLSILGLAYILERLLLFFQKKAL